MIGNYYKVQVNSKLSMASIKTVVLNIYIGLYMSRERL